MLNYESLLKEKIPFVSKKQLLRHVIICKKSTNKQLVDQHKILLFRRLHKVITKNIGKYLNMVSDRNTESTYNADDLVLESFIIFNKCLEKFDLNKYNDFLWFINTALSRAMIRFSDKERTKQNNTIDCGDDWIYSYAKGSYENEADFTEFYIKQFKLTRVEKKILYSKVKMEKIDFFLEKNRQITRGSYYKALQNIKDKFKELQDDN